MRRDDRTSRTGILLIVVAVAVAGCSSGDDGLPEGLRDISGLDPVGADGNGSADDAEPGEVQPDEADPGEPEVDADGEPHSEPDDASEGDNGVVTVSGVVVPDSAFQINPDLDLDPDQQRELLQFSLDAYLYTTDAANRGEWEPADVARFYAAEALDSTITRFEYDAAEGLRQVNEGTIVEYLRVERFDGGGAIIHRCIQRGANDGIVDVGTGEYSWRPDDAYWSSEIHLALIAIEDKDPAWRVIGGAANDAISCP